MIKDEHLLDDRIEILFDKYLYLLLRYFFLIGFGITLAFSLIFISFRTLDYYLELDSQDVCVLCKIDLNQSN